MPGPEAVMALIRARRSVFTKDYTGGKVPREQIEQLLEAANWAPTHHLTQPWKSVGSALRRGGVEKTCYPLLLVKHTLAAAG